jgi:uncharacterized protein (TIGR00725 family)
MRRPIVAVIGTADISSREYEAALEVGGLIAQKGWTLVSGGLTGVMEAASRGAHEAGGAVVGILPSGSTESANKYVTIPIATNMGHARNVVIAHTADMLIAVGGGLGTLSEIAISRKLGKPVFSLGSWKIADTISVRNPRGAIDRCQAYLDSVLDKMFGVTEEEEI